MGKFGLNFSNQLRHLMVTGQFLRAKVENGKKCRERWSHDKVVRTTHGVNCTGSCSWKVFVKTA